MWLQAPSIFCANLFRSLPNQTLPLLAGDSPHPNGERKVKGPYFEFAKKKWETEDTFRHASILADVMLSFPPGYACCAVMLLACYQSC